ncbi:MAG: PKD domain-containing protein, partial [Flavobacterium sp.]
MGETNSTQLITYDMIIDYEYKVSGSYYISLIVEDENGLQSEPSNSQSVLVNQAPICFFIMLSMSSYSGIVTFQTNTTYTWDLDGKIIDYIWTFGDGASLRGTSLELVQHKYDMSGNYTVTLTVIDNMNSTAQYILETFVILDELSIPDCMDITSPNFGTTNNIVSESISINYAPTVNLHYWTNVSNPNHFFFSGQSSFDFDGSIISYQWQLNRQNLTEKPFFDIHINEGGITEVALIIKDNQGAIANKSLFIDVPYLPLAVFEIYAINESSILLDASHSLSFPRNINNLTSYTWSIKDINNVEIKQKDTKSELVLLLADGLYYISLLIEDSQGQTASRSQTFTMGNIDKGSEIMTLPMY